VTRPSRPCAWRVKEPNPPHVSLKISFREWTRKGKSVNPRSVQLRHVSRNVTHDLWCSSPQLHCFTHQRRPRSTYATSTQFRDFSETGTWSITASRVLRLGIRTKTVTFNVVGMRCCIAKSTLSHKFSCSGPKIKIRNRSEFQWRSRSYD
jgi:hypothetical protein